MSYDTILNIADKILHSCYEIPFSFLREVYYWKCHHFIYLDLSDILLKDIVMGTLDCMTEVA